MKRSGFQQPARPPAKQIGEGYTLRARPVARAGGVEPNSTLVQTPKPEKAKPGRRTPTAEERRWLDWVAQQPCVAGADCAGRLEVHHMLRAGRRIGHLHTLPLCPWHHQGCPTARHPWKARFEASYGTEAELLSRLQDRYKSA